VSNPRKGTERKAHFVASGDHDGSEATQILNISDATINWIAFALWLDETFLGAKTTRNKDKLEMQYTVTKHSEPFCLNVLYTLAPIIETLQPLRQSDLSKLVFCSSTVSLSHPLNTRHSFQRLRGAHLTHEQNESRKNDLPDGGAFNTKYRGTLHYSTHHYSIHM